MPTLCVHLPLDAPSPGVLLDYALSTDGTHVQDQGNLAWSQWAALAPNVREAVIVLPMSALSWHRLVLPPGSLPKAWTTSQASSRLRAILDGLLEERLLDEPTSMHLALQPAPVSAKPVWVVACNRSWLASWLEAFSGVGLSVKRIVPALTPEQLEGNCYALGDADDAQLTFLADASPSGASILTCAVGSSALALLGPPASRQARQLIAEPGASARAEEFLGQPAVLQQRGQRLVDALASDWDLAQFEIGATLGHRQLAGLRRVASQWLHGPQWRLARWSLLALVLVNLFGLNAWAIHLQSSWKQQSEQITVILKQTFPDVAVVVDAPVQMERSLALLQRSRGVVAGIALETLLSQFAARAPKGYQIEAIDFAAGELKLTAAELSQERRQILIRELGADRIQARWQGGQWLLQSERSVR